MPVVWTLCCGALLLPVEAKWMRHLPVQQYPWQRRPVWSELSRKQEIKSKISRAEYIVLVVQRELGIVALLIKVMKPEVGTAVNMRAV